MSQLRRALIAALLLSAICPAGVFAQVNTLERDNPREDARLKWGPFYITPRIGLTELGIDSNVFNDHEGEDRKQDFTFTLTPTGTVWVPFARRGLFKATVSSDLVYYREFDSERSIDSNFGGRGEAYFHRFTLFGDAAIRHAKQRPNQDLDLRVRRTEQVLSGGVDARLWPKIFLELAGAYESYAYDRETSVFARLVGDRLDRTATGFTGTVRYRYSPLTMFALRGERKETRFTATPARDNDSVRITTGVELEPRALITGEAWVGIRHLNPVDEGVLAEFKGFVSDVRVRYALRGTTVFELRHSRDLDYSAETVDPYFVQTGFQLSVRRALGPLFDIVVDGGRSVSNYRALLDVPVPAGEERRDVNISYGGSFGIRVGREGRIGLGATYSRRDSTDIVRQYEGIRLRTTATYGF